ncbi:toxin glutamine deamidase domain-containing protein [Streptomyces sp. NPDC002994]|uniref:toxin glutamine deamidase domain-containing protein n=1 Tax=Streptomyces sp. NPDC002994 TaxID=3154441 RepID=UPI0033BC4C25
MMLPDEVEWILEMLGYKWPTANEDLLRDSAALWRQFGDDAQKLHIRANTSAQTVIAHNAGESIDKFITHYKKFSDGGSDGYLAKASEAAYIIATTFEAAATLVEFAKYAVIVQLFALAFQIAAAAAASIVTFGLSAAAGMAATQLTRVAVRRILDALKDALMQAIIEMMKEPAVSAVQAMVTDLVTQSVNVGFGTQEGFDLSKTVSAGAKGGWEAIKQSPQTFAEGLRDGLGRKAGSSVRDGIDSGYNNSMDAYRNRSNPTADNNSGDGTDGTSSNSGDGDDSSGDTGSSNSSNSSDSSDSSASSDSSNSSSSDSSTTSPSNANTGNTNIGGNISADGDDPGSYSAPDLGSLPTTDTGSGTPDSSPGAPDSGQNPSSSNSPSRPTLSDFDDPAPSNTSPSPSPAPDTSSNTPSAGDTRGGSSSPGGLTSPSPQSAPTPTAGATPSSTNSGGGISTSIDSLAASIPTQSNAAPAPTTADPSTAAPRPDGNSSMPTSPTPPSTADGAAGARTGTNTTPGGSTSGTSPTSPNPSQGPPRTPSTTPGTPNPTGTGPASTPSPTPSTPPRSTPTPSTDARTPGTPETRTPNPNQPAPGTTPGRTSNPSPPNSTSTPTPTPGATTTPSTSTPGSAGTRTPNTNPASTTPHTSRPESTTPSQDPRQPTPTRTTQSHPGTPAATPSPNASDSNAPGRTPDRSSTPNSSTPSSPSTPNQPGATPSPNPGNKPQQPGSQPNTPQNTQPSPANTPNTPNTQNQQQQQQVTAVPIQTVTPAPSGHTAQPTTQNANTTAPPQQQGQEDNNTKPTTPTPAATTRNTTPPGGVTDPTRAEQDALDNSVPRDENGDPTRPPDPKDGDWVERINGEGRDAPGRNNNCVDTALSTVDTFAGNPTAAGARTPDHDADGNPSDRGEKGGRDRIENTLGARFSDMGNGRDAFNRLENTLRNSGHGSQAVIITQDANGRAHAWNAVNHNGKITYIDAQTGQQSSKPLHSGNNGVFAIPLDSNRQPVSSDSGTTGDRSRPDGTNRTSRQTPATSAGQSRRPPEDPAGQSPSKDDGKLPDDPTREKRNESLPEPEGRTDEHLDLPPDSPQQELRNYESDDQHEHKDYDPDAERGLKVHRIGLDPVHDSLRSWAAEGRLTPLLQSAADRMEAYNKAREKGDTDLPPTAFTRQELEDALGDDFRQMNDGQRYAVVASLARLSLGYHESQGVGHNPEHDRDGKPYTGAKRRDGSDDVAADKDRGVSSESRDNAKAKFPKQYREDPETKKDLENLHQQVTGKKKSPLTDKAVNGLIDAMGPHKPDFSGKNYAVIEVVDKDGNSTFVVDSSVPTDGSRVSPRHSEKHLLDWFDRTNSGPDGEKYRLAGLYTEREPCGKGQGHADCSTRVRGHPSFKDGKLPVYYSTTYRTDPEGVAMRDEEREKWKKKQDEAIEKMGDVTPAEREEKLKKLKLTNKQISTKVGELRSEKEQDMDAEMDEHLSAIGSAWAKAMLHMPKPS